MHRNSFGSLRGRNAICAGITNLSLRAPFLFALFVFGFLPLPHVACAQVTPDWTLQYGSQYTDWVRGLGTDSSGNMYAFGETRIADFNGVAPVGSVDFYISKFDATGTEQWTVVQGSTTSDPVSGRMAVDDAGNCYVAGETWGSVYGPKGSGLADGWFGKYDTNGNLVWGHQINSDGWNTPKNVVVDSSNNSYLVGWTDGGLDGPSAGDQDVYVRKYDTDGNLLWGTQFGSDKADRGYDVVANDAGEVYVVGSTYGDLAGISNPGAPSRPGGFLTKLDSSGSILWTELLATDQIDNLYGVDLDSGGNVVMAGYTIGDLNGQTGAGVQDMLLTKYDSSGSEIWTEYLGGTGTDYGYDIEIDGADNIFFSGQTTSTDGDFAATTAFGGYDAVLAKYDGDGNWIWTERYGGTDSDLISPLHMESDGTLYAGGSTRGAWVEPNLYGSDGINYDSVLMRFDALGAPSSGGGGGPAVPEPTTVVLLALGGFSLVLMRRRRK
ncbi:MAG: PEP-CTERM sorting domain-containing protein [Pirellulales bacterium]|jgi:hypothetical protein|nr:PEP-CTERM sorting domain-containing protein [Pirellulales bacterium]HJN65578.1 PEP-CTERM sorting domain-containing protein [Pirellulales bacterium]|tara:strand:- start:66 stop:1550 length:1485 start_codon:yes stop_codon:yes gene_type:complete